MPLQNEIRMERKDSFCVVGLSYWGNNCNQEIAQLWHLAAQHCNEITNRAEPECCGYGLITYTPDFFETGQMHYMCVTPVQDLSSIPLHLSGKIIPAAEYCVFTHEGPVKGIGDSYKQIYHERLPASEYESAAPYDFERYDMRFKSGDASDSVVEIWIPAKKKS